MFRRKCVNRILLGLMALIAVATSLEAATDTERHLVLRADVLRWIQERNRCGSRHRPTFRQLLDRIEASHTYVFVDPMTCWSDSNDACTSVGSTAPGGRFLRVRATRVSAPWHLVAILAHEFQHVVEILQHPEVVDADSLRTLYRGIGFAQGRSWNREAWETTQAQRTQRTVAAEAAEYRRLTHLMARR